MSEKKFTPGPWKWTDEDYIVLESQTPQENRFSKTGFILPDVLRADYEPVGNYGCAPVVHIDNDADAHLIAAAPDMHDALETTLENIRSLGPAGALYDTYNPWERLVESALRKARGEE